jgi:hypothetical protein
VALVDPISVAALIVAAVGLAWTIVHDIRRERARLSVEELADLLRESIDAPDDLDPDAQDAVVDTAAKVILDADK